METSTPQLKNGYTRIANELLDALISRNFGLQEYKILLCIIRKTYGFNKKTDDMTLTQIANTTGLDLGNVSKKIKSLSARNILLKQQGKYGYILGLNKHYGTWKVLSIQQSVVKTTSEACQNNKISLLNEQSQKKLSKDKTKTDSKFLEFWIAYPKKIAKQEAEKAFNKLNIDDNLLLTLLSALSTAKQSKNWLKNNGEYIPHAATWLNQHRWEDEIVNLNPNIPDLMAGVL